MTNQNEHYDIVIAYGRVIDPETGLDAVRNVGIKGDKIAAVTEESITGKETIDATGHVGCSRLHRHAISTMSAFPSVRSWRCAMA